MERMCWNPESILDHQGRLNPHKRPVPTEQNEFL